VNDFAESKNDLADVVNDFAESKYDPADVTTDFAELKYDPAAVANDFAEVKNGFAELKNDFAELKNDFADRIKSLFLIINEVFRVKSTFLAGKDYESKYFKSVTLCHCAVEVKVQRFISPPRL